MNAVNREIGFVERFFGDQFAAFKGKIADSRFIEHFHLFHNAFRFPFTTDHRIQPNGIIKDGVICITPTRNHFMPLELFENQASVIIERGEQPNNAFVQAVLGNGFH